MTYTVHMLYPTQGDPPREKRLDGEFVAVKEAFEAGAAEVLSCKLRSVDASFQIRDSDGRHVEVIAEQAAGN